MASRDPASNQLNDYKKSIKVIYFTLIKYIIIHSFENYLLTFNIESNKTPFVSNLTTRLKLNDR